MSRTFRCRHAVPKGYTYRDGCETIMYEGCPGLRAYMSIPWRFWNHPQENEGIPEWFFRMHDAPKVRTRWANKEKKDYRKIHQRRYRGYERRLLHHERWEDILPYKRTSGWMTW